MKIGKIIKSESHLNYKCRIYGKRETGRDVSEKDFHFGQFVKVKIFDDKYIAGIIFNSQLYNPEYGNFGPRLTNPPDYNMVSIPDFIDETAILVDIHLLGWMENGNYLQEVPPWVIPLNSEVTTMSDKDIICFHYDDKQQLCLKYYNEVIAHTGNIATQLLLNIINYLSDRVDESEKPRLKLLKQHILWQQTHTKVKV